MSSVALLIVLDERLSGREDLMKEKILMLCVMFNVNSGLFGTEEICE